MANIKQIKDESLATIDAALAILNKFPDLNSTNSLLSYDNSSNPFPFLMDIFKSTAGYNVLINILSKFILVALPPMEVTIKAVLLSNIKNLLSCSINPFISEELLRDGIVFSLDDIDICDTLKYCPTDNIGRYYYFSNTNGTVEVEELDEETNEIILKKQTSFKTADELKDSKDFNCLLWYMKNKAMFREVWGKKVTDNNSWVEDSDYWNAKKGKCRKGAGIITLEYNARSQGLRNAEGNGLSIQTPYNNIIHVFLGNTKEKENEEILEAEKDFSDNAKELTKKNNQLTLNQTAIEQIKKEKELQKKYLEQNKITEEEYKSEIEKLDKDIQIYIEKIGDDTKGLKKEIKDLTDEKIELIKTLKKCQENIAEYRSIKQNYYYRHTLLEFNTDYVMSLQLFDPKVVTAQLLDALVGLLTVDLHLSYKQQLIKNEIQKMIKMVVETDDTVVDDCFFTFSNADYDSMSEKAELNRAGLFSINGEENTIYNINAESLLSSLNEFDTNAESSGNIEIIEHALTEISKTISSTEETKTSSINFGVQMNFIENLMNNLAYVIAYSVLSPKLYLLILINLKILGNETNFDLEKFIGSFKQLIVTLIRSIRDQLLKYLTDELMKIVGNIATEIAIKIGVEQMQYYSRLIKRIYDCIKFGKGSNLDWNMDDVDYADIETEEISEEKPKTEC